MVVAIVVGQFDFHVCIGREIDRAERHITKETRLGTLYFFKFKKLLSELRDFITLYSPKNPSSFITDPALILVAVAISPATCSLIFTISSGLVKIT